MNRIFISLKSTFSSKVKSHFLVSSIYETKKCDTFFFFFVSTIRNTIFTLLSLELPVMFSATLLHYRSLVNFCYAQHDKCIRFGAFKFKHVPLFETRTMANVIVNTHHAINTLFVFSPLIATEHLSVLNDHFFCHWISIEAGIYIQNTHSMNSLTRFQWDKTG